ncbi:MAG TPA: NAD(P)/FAD-dependent oxidoreductase [Methylomirabilota bacterium]|nr:NAD(P)/FAD-dependent oxidoreductase [Methylomirabilota bacterium]
MHDVIVIGGGPAGSAAATFLAKGGKRVLVLEKEVFPRFHIGESLLPYNRSIFAEMGVLPDLEAAGFPRKRGAQFHTGTGNHSLFFVFSQGRFTREHEAFQVERAVFDDILLKHARKVGAEVREGWSVSKVEEGEGAVRVHVTDPQGQRSVLESAYVVDASGRGNLTGNQEGLRVAHPNLRKLAVFGHFRNVKLDEGSPGGDTIIVRLANRWFWIIPISKEKTSVGVVMDAAEFARLKQEPSVLFESIWRKSPPLIARMKDAELVGSIQTTSDFSYRNRTFFSNRVLRAGDAAGFLDPIFSSGVYLAMFSGKLAAESILAVMASPSRRASVFQRYEKRVRAGLDFYWEMVEHFYTRPFLEIFFQPRERFQLASAVNAALAGELHGGWKIAWRMRLFFLLVKAQARWRFNRPMRLE